MSWISSLDGPTKGRHEEVPKELLEEAERAAKRALEGDDEEEEDASKATGNEGERMEE
jgi:20S proteasome subunit alpha 7